MAPQVAGAASAISPQGPACWLRTRKKEKEHGRIQFTLVPVLSSSEATVCLVIWIHVLPSFSILFAQCLWHCHRICLHTLLDLPTCCLYTSPRKTQPPWCTDSARDCQDSTSQELLMSTCDMPGCPSVLAACFILQSLRKQTAVWLCVVKPWDFFQKLMHNVLCFPFIDVQNAFCPEAILRQSLMQYFFYSNILHSFSHNVSRFVSNKCFWKTVICQMGVSSKGLLHFHWFILLG